MFNNIYSQKQEIEALYEQAAASNEELNSYIKNWTNKEELNQKNIELMTLLTTFSMAIFRRLCVLPIPSRQRILTQEGIARGLWKYPVNLQGQ